MQYVKMFNDSHAIQCDQYLLVCVCVCVFRFLLAFRSKPLNFKFCFTAWLQNPVACFQFHPGMATSPNDTVDRESIDNIIYTWADDIHGLCRSLIILQTYGDDFPICLLANISYNLTPTNVPLWCFYVPRSQGVCAVLWDFLFARHLVHDMQMQRKTRVQL